MVDPVNGCNDVFSVMVKNTFEVCIGLENVGDTNGNTTTNETDNSTTTDPAPRPPVPDAR